MSKGPSFNIPIARTSFTSTEIASVLQPLESGWLVQGPKLLSLKRMVCFNKSKFSIAMNGALAHSICHCWHSASKAGDEIIVPAFTWVSTANVCEFLGAKVVFCDIDIDTFNISVAQLQKLITPKTKAIMPVHLFGLAADMAPIMELARSHGIYVVEDAACGLGAKYKGINVGNFGNTGCFSFHPRKTITTGEGGIVTCSDPDLGEKITRLRDHGAQITDLQRHLGNKPYLLADHPEPGLNQRMTDIQAALGVAQMSRVHDILRERRRLADIYNEAFESVDWLQTPFSDSNYEHGYQSFPCLFLPQEKGIKNIEKTHQRRNSFMSYLQSVGISTRPATHAVHMLSYYSKRYNVAPEDYPNSFRANHASVSLPLFHGLLELEQQYVIEKVREYKV